MIVNNHALNVAVFNVAHGRRERLGEVTAMASSSFKLHLRRLPANEIQLRADPIGSTATGDERVGARFAGRSRSMDARIELARSHIAIR